MKYIRYIGPLGPGYPINAETQQIVPQPILHPTILI